MPNSSLPKLHASPPADLAFSKVSQVRAFVLERDAGNLLIYAAKTLPADAAADVSAQYLNHWHELAVGGADSVHAPLVIHEADRAAAEDTHAVDRTFNERATLDGDFELVPIPGHTPGATAFLWDSGEHRFLFTGDSLYLRDGRWIVAVLEDSDREAYIDSLGLIARARLRRAGALGREQGQPLLLAHEPGRDPRADRRHHRTAAARGDELMRRR